jgi:hypothetical protein
MRIGLEARVMHHAVYTLAMPSDALHTEVWKAAAGGHCSVAAGGVTLSHGEEKYGGGGISR